jgi:hypothetical protein
MEKFSHSQMIHIAGEFVIISGIAVYFSRKNNQLEKRLSTLEEAFKELKEQIEVSCDEQKNCTDKVVEMRSVVRELARARTSLPSETRSVPDTRIALQPDMRRDVPQEAKVQPRHVPNVLQNVQPRARRGVTRIGFPDELNTETQTPTVVPLRTPQNMSNFNPLSLMSSALPIIMGLTQGMRNTGDNTTSENLQPPQTKTISVEELDAELKDELQRLNAV